MYVLAIDTSSPAVTTGVVLVDNGRPAVAAERAPLAARGHGELLAPAIDACLRDVGITAADLGAVVVGVGPGPFTGLRVGMVTAMAVADAVTVPIYGVCSLDAIAVQAPADENGDLVVLTDARRKEVYWARYDGRRSRLAGPEVALPADVPLDGVPNLAGAAADLYADVYADLWSAAVPLPYRYPSAESLVRLALDRIHAGAPGETVEPLYLRRPDAVVPGAPKTVSQ